MDRHFKILIAFILISIFLFLIFDVFSSNKKILFIRESVGEFFKQENTEAILVLGKMGAGHYGSENTDAMLVLYLKDDKVFIIHIPRDLIVNINGENYKINSLYGFKKINELLKEVSLFTGIKVRKYIVFDNYILKEVVNKLGGLKVTLIYPVTDAVSGYTLKPGTYILNGEWVEFVVRSRYYPDGDFTRMKNQFIIIKSLKAQLSKEPLDKLLKIANDVIKMRNHYETNLEYAELLSFLNKLTKIPAENFKEIHLGYDKNLWSDGYFNIKINSHSAEAYGLIPKNGEGEYSTIRSIIKEKIKEETSKKY